jgi:hypothetical protein
MSERAAFRDLPYGATFRIPPALLEWKDLSPSVLHRKLSSAYAEVAEGWHAGDLRAMLAESPVLPEVET